MSTEELTASSPMPFGKHKGKAMINVPATYLLWLYNEGCNNAPVKRYILDNLQAIQQEAAKQQNYKRR